MSAVYLLRRLRQAGFELTVEADCVWVQPASALTPSMREEIVVHKPWLLKLLRAEAAYPPLPPECYCGQPDPLDPLGDLRAMLACGCIRGFGSESYLRQRLADLDDPRLADEAALALFRLRGAIGRMHALGARAMQSRASSSWSAPPALWWQRHPWYGQITVDEFRAIVATYVARYGVYTPDLPSREPAILRDWPRARLFVRLL